MRHKYRAWDFDGECFAYSSEESEYYCWGFEDGKLKAWAIVEKTPDDPMEAPYPDSEEIEPIEQWTGLKDKAGVESYKDDIYHLKDFTDEYIMLWDDTGAYFYLKGIHGGEVKPASMVSTGEKIGDKHSNPELIENGKE